MHLHAWMEDDRAVKQVRSGPAEVIERILPVMKAFVGAAGNRLERALEDHVGRLEEEAEAEGFAELLDGRVRHRHEHVGALNGEALVAPAKGDFVRGVGRRGREGGVRGRNLGLVWLGLRLSLGCGKEVEVEVYCGEVEGFGKSCPGGSGGWLEFSRLVGTRYGETQVWVRGRGQVTLGDWLVGDGQTWVKLWWLRRPGYHILGGVCLRLWLCSSCLSPAITPNGVCCARTSSSPPFVTVVCVKVLTAGLYDGDELFFGCKKLSA